MTEIKADLSISQLKEDEWRKRRKNWQGRLDDDDDEIINSLDPFIKKKKKKELKRRDLE